MAPLRAADPTGIASLPKFERKGIKKLSKLTATDHSTILFTIGEETIGFAKDGAVGRIGKDWVGHCNRWTHPDLSHNGRMVAYVSDSESRSAALHSCRIAVRDLVTGVERTLIELSEDPGEISWSWDDARIAFWDPDGGLSEISVADRRVRRLSYKIDPKLHHWVWCETAWLHNGKGFLAELLEQVPDGPRGFREQGTLVLLSGGDARVIGIGSAPAVSPLSDRIAYHTEEGVLASNADGTERTVLAERPRSLLFFREDILGSMVWSPDATRIFFGTIVSEDRSDKLYVLDVRSGRTRQFLSHTSIAIRGWR